jgi:hypothetical protein
MDNHEDHVTIVVRDVEVAEQFFPPEANPLATGMD